MAGQLPGSRAKDYELYLEERRILIAAQRETAASFDKAILTLASGAFAVSLVFLKDVVPKPFANTRWLLGCSWTLFALSLVTILTGFLASQAACTRQIELCEKELLRDAEGESPQKKERENNWAKFAHVCNWGSIAILAFAMGFSGVFVYYNYLHR